MKVYSSYNANHNKNYYKLPFYKSKKFYIVFLLIAAILIFIFWSITKQPAEQTEEIDLGIADEQTEANLLAQVTQITGSLFLLDDQQNQTALSAHENLQQGDVIKTAEDSKAIITLPDNSIIRLDADSQIKLSQFGLADIIIEHQQGQTFHRVNEDSAAIYRVTSEQTEMTALGTGFNVQTKSNKLYLTVTESNVKVKIYETNALESLVTMRTIEQGYEATINPKLEGADAIDSGEADVSDLLDDPWLVWNKEKDHQQDFNLGVFEKSIPIEITEPQQTEFETDEDTIIIKGATDPEAEIFIDGQETDNNDGQFEIEIELENGLNEIEITVLKGQNKNKKILLITSTKQADGELQLTASSDDNTVKLNWQLSEAEAPSGFRTLMSGTNDPTYPDSTYHKISANTFTDSWSDLDSGDYYFRVCVYENMECVLYSSTEKITINNREEETTISDDASISLSGQISEQQAKLTWSADNVQNAENFQVLINTSANPSYPSSSSHVLNINDRSDTWKNLDSGTYHFRVCAFAQNQCLLYSNDLTLEIKEQQTQDQPTSISLSASCTDQVVNLSWQANNLSSNKGFYVLVSQSQNPSFPEAQFQLLTGNETSATWENLTFGQTYYFRICENTGSTCGTYSNQISIEIK